MSSEIGEEPFPSVSPGSSQPAPSGGRDSSSRVGATPDLMNISPLDGGGSVERNSVDVGSSASTTVKEALKKQEWLDTQIHKLKVQLYMKKSEQCKAIDNLSVDELNTLYRKLKDELTSKTAVIDGQEQILRGEHLLRTAQDILSKDAEGGGDNSLADKKELENLLNEFTQVSSDAAREHKEIAKLKSELTEVKKRNFDLLKKSRKLYQEIDRKKQLKEEEIDMLSSDPVGKTLHEELKTKLQVNTVQCHILQGLIMGSGVNWAQDQSLQKLLLETAQPDQL